MDSETLEGDLDLILGPAANAEPVGEWDWEPTTVPTASSAYEPEEADEADSQASDDEDDEEDD